MLTVANDELLAKIEANKKKTGFTVNEAGESAMKTSLLPLSVSSVEKYCWLISGLPGAVHAAWLTKK